MDKPINLVKVNSLYEIDSPYADDESITRYYNPFVTEGDWSRAYRATQDKLREFEDFTHGEFNRFLRGRATNLKAFDAWLVWKKQTRGIARPPKFEFKERNL
ncbi:hypothetical protein F4V47_01335 [Lactococcus garvieae subsp. garvieae]|uniref:hypothetical protein n=1 Tax=Lactococcus garvieae TaxID=1363 RepID=UPI0005AA037F|nr:hypothetical protein [Lactococcus garvieae]KAA8718792.1 hypothetical protein F4V47_01335 [Lactococcus garvieae subsp. garvieae]MDG6191170.1 hypothetical protein [Lactococcus garvieae]QPR49005.1 hypothetical protein I6G86_00475 [Lactococcus garvieae]